VAAVLAAQLLSGQPQGAESNTAVTDDTGSSNVVYGEEFFAKYNVTTAEDILRRIPGVAAMLDVPNEGPDAQRRGFGSEGDQILINGRRLAGKSNEISSALRRIQIQNLERVELLRGTSNDIDVRSDGIVVNIILKEGGVATSTGSVTLAAQMNEYGWTDLDGAVNYNGELGSLSYFVSLDKNSISQDQRGGFTRRKRDETYLYPTGEVMQIRESVTDRDLQEYSFTANSTYDFARGDKLQFNALVKPSSLDESNVAPFTEYAVDGSTGLSAIDLRSLVIDRRLEWELGGTYERQIGDSSNLKILTVYSSDDTSSVEARNQLTGEQFDEISSNLSEVLKTEAIIRGSYYRPLSGKQTIEMGAEVARNSLDQTIDVSFDLDGDGIADPIDIFAPSSTVEETRSEIFVNHDWTLSSRWTAASSLVAENSEISQRGVDINNTTQFSFVKPRLDLRFALNPSDQFRLKIERTVSQLDFANFVPKYEIRQDRFSAGNPDLRPETAWEYELGLEHRLPNDQGVVQVRMFYNDIQDRIESVAVDLDGDGAFEPASGNIGAATEHGGELTFSVRMTRFGAPDLILDGQYLARKSSVTDPFTGLDRKMATMEDFIAGLSIRHDIAASNLSYGISYQHNGGRNVRSEWQEYRYFSREPEINAFLEKRFGSRWTLRFDALGLSGNKRERNRLIYAVDAADGAISRREYYDETRDRRYTLSLTSTF